MMEALIKLALAIVGLICVGLGLTATPTNWVLVVVGVILLAVAGFWVFIFSDDSSGGWFD